MKMMDVFNRDYKLPFGCGTIAIYNALTWGGFASAVEIKRIQYLIKEKNKVSKAKDITEGLDKLGEFIGFEHQEKVDEAACLSALDSGACVILLSWPDQKTHIGHYTFFFKKGEFLFENDKLSAKPYFKRNIQQRCPITKQPTQAWIIRRAYE